MLIRSDGEPTYFAPDIAYHRDKLERGADRLIDVLGADHHGYLGRMRAALAALGEPPERLEFADHAARPRRRGRRARADVEAPRRVRDARRADRRHRRRRGPLLHAAAQPRHDVDLDLDLARSQSNENPVYYVQYAHARIASILRKAGEERRRAAAAAADGGSGAPVEPAERALIKRLLELPGEVAEAAERRAPHRLCAYAMTIAADFHAFYRDCQVVGAEGEGVEEARLALCLATKRLIARMLGLLGISAPERM